MEYRTSTTGAAAKQRTISNLNNELLKVMVRPLLVKLSIKCIDGERPQEDEGTYWDTVGVMSL